MLKTGIAAAAGTLAHRRLLVVAVPLALALVLVGVHFATQSDSRPTITLSAATGGHISPEGETKVAVGDQLTVTTWADDGEMTPWLVVDGTSVEPQSNSNGRSTYTFTVQGDALVQGSFIELGKNVRLLTPGVGPHIVSVSNDQTEVVISGSIDFVSGLAIDDILVNQPGTGYGGRLNVRILGTQTVGELTTLQTESVPFTDALIKASIHATFPLTPPPAKTQTSSIMGPETANAAVTIGRNLHLDLAREISFQAGTSTTKVGGGSINLGGSLDLGATMTIDLQIDLKAQFGFPPITGELKRFELSCNWSAAVTVSVGGQAAGESEGVLDSMKLPGTWVVPGIFVDPDLSVLLTTKVSSAEHVIGFAAEADVTARVGMLFENGQLSPITEFSVHGGGSSDGHAGYTVRLSPAFRLEAEIDKACGPYIQAGPYLESSLDPAKNPWWELDGGLSASAGVACEFGPISVDGKLVGTDLYASVLASSSGAYPTTTPDPTSAAASTPTPLATPSLAGGSVSDITITAASARHRPNTSLVATEHVFELARFENKRTDLAALIFPTYAAKDGHGRSLGPAESLLDPTGEGLFIPPGDSVTDWANVSDPSVAGFDVTIRKIVWFRPPTAGKYVPLSYKSGKGCPTDADGYLTGCTYVNPNPYPLRMKTGVIYYYTNPELDQSSGGKSEIWIWGLGAFGASTTIPANGSATTPVDLTEESAMSDRLWADEIPPAPWVSRQISEGIFDAYQPGFVPVDDTDWQPGSNGPDLVNPQSTGGGSVATGTAWFCASQDGPRQPGTHLDGRTWCDQGAADPDAGRAFSENAIWIGDLTPDQQNAVCEDRTSWSGFTSQDECLSFIQDETANEAAGRY